MKNKSIILPRELLDIGSILTVIQETSNVLGIHQSKACLGEVIYGILTDVCLTVDSRTHSLVISPILKLLIGMEMFSNWQNSTQAFRLSQSDEMTK